MSRLGFLRRYLDDAGEPAECELCAGPLEHEHRHVVEVRARRILCACDPCALLFAGPSTRRFRTIPEHVRRETPFTAQEAWDALGLADGSFVLFGSGDQRWIAVEPCATGGAERVLDPVRWHAVWTRSELARAVASDVEALIVRRGRQVEAFAAPVDRCYGLTGAMRRRWHGEDGGADARAALETFFEALGRDSEPLPTHQEQEDRP
jgi:hypothetical protein